MICQVIDGMFDSRFLAELDYKLRDLPVHTNNVANSSSWPYGYEGTHRLFGKTIFKRNSINRIITLDENASVFFDIFEEIEKRFDKKLYLYEISINCQHTGCNGSTHIDSHTETEYTVMLMTNSHWDPSWGGQFQLTKGDEVVEEHEYVPGRLLIIPSTHEHRGLGPTKEYVYRYTLVYRIRYLEEIV